MSGLCLFDDWLSAFASPCREHARGIPGKAQLFINAFARALEVIPRQVGIWWAQAPVKAATPLLWRCSGPAAGVLSCTRPLGAPPTLNPLAPPCLLFSAPQLADNSGFDATDVLNKLRQAHAAKDGSGRNIGIDVNTGG